MSIAHMSLEKREQKHLTRSTRERKSAVVTIGYERLAYVTRATRYKLNIRLRAWWVAQQVRAASVELPAAIAAVQGALASRALPPSYPPVSMSILSTVNLPSTRQRTPKYCDTTHRNATEPLNTPHHICAYVHTSVPSTLWYTWGAW